MGISIDVSQIEGFQQKLKALNGTQRDIFFRECCMEGANRLVALVKPLEPPPYKSDDYNGHGTLRAGWDNALGSLGVASVSKSQGAGQSYSVTVENATPYASYVEYGHRQTPGRFVPAIGKRLVASWVEGNHALEISEGNLKKVLPGALQTKLDAFLRTVL